MNGMIRNGFSMIGRPNMIGSMMQKIAGGREMAARGLNCGTFLESYHMRISNGQQELTH